MKLAGKRCVVTGGASGIGRATALEFAREGARVALGDIDPQQGEKTAAMIRERGGEAVFVQGDIAREDDCRQLLDAAVHTFGGVDVLFNNAGINPLEGSILDVGVDQWRRVFAVNVDSIFHCSRFAIPEMRKAGGGRIINTASPASFKGWPNNVAYISSKGAVMALTRSMAMDLAKESIRVNALVPGLIMTGIGSNFIAAQADQEAVASGIPVGRPGKPEEVAPMVVYLAQDECSFSTGAAFFVDGGELSGVA